MGRQREEQPKVVVVREPGTSFLEGQSYYNVGQICSGAGASSPGTLSGSQTSYYVGAGDAGAASPVGMELKVQGPQ